MIQEAIPKVMKKKVLKRYIHDFLAIQTLFSDQRSATDDSGEENEWSSSSDEDEEPSGEVDLHQLAFERWGKKTDDTGKKSKLKKISEKAPKLRVPKQQVEQIIPHVGRSKEASIFYPGEKIDAETISKKLLDVTALRGRKGFDRLEQIRHLRELADKAAIVGSKTVLEILGHLISAYFDANLGKTIFPFSMLAFALRCFCLHAVNTVVAVLSTNRCCVVNLKERERLLFPICCDGRG